MDFLFFEYETEWNSQWSRFATLKDTPGCMTYKKLRSFGV